MIILNPLEQNEKNIKLWSVKSNWMDKSNKFGHFGVYNYLDDFVDSFVEYLDYSKENKQQGKDKTEIDIAEFTAHVENKLHSYRLNITYNFKATAKYSYTAKAYGNWEMWSYNNDCVGELVGFNLITYPNLKDEMIADYGKTKCKKYTVTKITIEDTSESKNLNAKFTKNIDKINAMSLSSKIDALIKQDLNLECNIPCNGFCFNFKHTINFLDFVFEASLGKDLYVYDEL